MSINKTDTPTTINFHVDPLCPLAWRTALWAREVRKVRPVTIQWKLFSLEVVNRAEGEEADYVNGRGWKALRTLAFVRREHGNEGFERLYIALGNSQHGEKRKSFDKQSILEDCVSTAGFEPTIVTTALNDESTIQDVLNDHQEAVQRYHAFGVPTIALENSNVGFYGPVIHTVPKGEEAGEWWDYTAWTLRQPNLFELKRERVGVEWGPVSAED